MQGVGFPKMWSGGRANIGLCGHHGKYMFEVKVVRELAVPEEEANAAPGTVHLCRIGWSCHGSPTHSLGETANGWGFGGTGRKSHAGRFEPYGEPYSVGDVVSCGLDLETCEICFAINGRSLGCAFTVQPATVAHGLFPHILLKNMQVEVSFASRLSPALPDFSLLESAIDGGVTTSPSEPLQRTELQMLVGLPAAGKTTWAEQEMDAQPEKNYLVLSTNSILEQMKVPGLTRAHNYKERFEKLMPQATAVLAKLLEIAPSRRRNFLWDQTNVYPSARKRKLSRFGSFVRLAAVFVCSTEELGKRSRAREAAEGKLVPEEAVQASLYMLSKLCAENSRLLQQLASHSGLLR